MKLIVGLGNPGKKYALNRHNVGFMAVDRIFDDYNFQPWRNRFSGELSEGMVGRTKCLLLKPSTYMNDSGRSVGETLRFYKLDLDDVIVLYDEIDLVPGKLKAKSGGGNAGHNGLRSLSSHLGNDYHRIRIGVGRPTHKAQVANHVLRDFHKSDFVWLEPLIDAIARKISFFLEQGAPSFLNEVAEHLSPLDEKPKKRKEPAIKGKKADVQKNQRASEISAKTKPSAGDRGPLADMLRSWNHSNKDEE